MARPRVALALALVTTAALSAAAWSQPAPPPPASRVKLLISPAAAPVPALKYQLLPDISDQGPGNAVQGYYWCFSPEFSSLRTQEQRDQVDKWLEMPLDKLSTKDFARFANVLDGIDRAARSRTCDWNLADRIRAERSGMLLPDIQGLSELGKWVAVRCRMELKEGRFAAAVESLKTLFALARHLDEHPTVIGSLVGNRVAGLAADRVEEFVTRPGAPNLYWALSNLPAPLLTGQRGAAFDRMIQRIDTGLEADELTPWDAGKQARVLAGVVDMLGYDLPGLVPGARARALARWTAWAADPAQLEFARKRLGATVPSEALDRLPPSQIVLLDTARELDAARDDVLKWAGLPYWQAADKIRMAQSRFEAWVDRLPDKGVWFPQGAWVSRAPAVRARTDPRLAALRVVEAIRLSAAGDGRTFPADLAAVTVPVPADPATGRPFDYATSAEGAELRFTPPSKEPGKTIEKPVVLVLVARK
jgi:hypothetical protein